LTFPRRSIAAPAPAALAGAGGPLRPLLPVLEAPRRPLLPVLELLSFFANKKKPQVVVKHR